MNSGGTVGNGWAAALKNPTMPPLLTANRNFRLYFLARGFTALTLAISPIVLPFAVIQVGGTVSSVGTVLTAQELPIIAFILIGGVLGDRYERMTMLGAANGLSALTQLGLFGLLLTHTHALAGFVALAALNGIASAVALPAGAGFVAQIVAPRDVTTAQGLLSASRTTLMVGGAAFGGVLVSVATPAGALVVNALFYAGSLVPIFMIKATRTSRAVYTSVARDLAEGWSELWRRRWLPITLIQTLTYTLFTVATYGILAPTIAHQRLGGATGLGFLMAARAVGSLGGAVLSMKARVRNPLSAAQFGLVLQAGALVAIGFSAPYAAIMVAVALDGVCAEFFSVHWSAAVQRTVAPGLLSRVTSYCSLVNYTSTPLAAGMVPVLAGLLSTSQIFFTMAVLSVGVTLLAGASKTTARQTALPPATMVDTQLADR